MSPRPDVVAAFRKRARRSLAPLVGRSPEDLLADTATSIGAYVSLREVAGGGSYYRMEAVSELADHLALELESALADVDETCRDWSERFREGLGLLFNMLGRFRRRASDSAKLWLRQQERGRIYPADHLTPAIPFGLYLIEMGHLSSEEIMRALIKQEQSQASPLAIMHSYHGLDPIQCLEIAEYAMNSGSDAFHAGERLGIFRRNEADEMRILQRRSRPPLGWVLMECGLAVPSQVVQWLSDHQREGGERFNPADWESAPQEAIDGGDSTARRVADKPTTTRALASLRKKYQEDTNIQIPEVGPLALDSSSLRDYEQVLDEALLEGMLALIAGLNEGDVSAREHLLHELFAELQVIKRESSFIGAVATTRVVKALEACLVTLDRGGPHPEQLADAQQLLERGVRFIWDLRDIIIVLREETPFLTRKGQAFREFLRAVRELVHSVPLTRRESASIRLAGETR